MSCRTSPFLLLILVSATAVAVAQEVESKKVVLPDFDIRDDVLQVAASRARNRALIDRRQSAIKSHVAARPGSRIVQNEFGLPKLYISDGAALSTASSRPHEEIAKSFLAAQPSLFPFTALELEQLRLTVRDVTPEATFLAYQQTLNGIDVFNGHVRLTLSRTGEVVQAGVGDIVPGLRIVTTPRLSAEEAAREAMRSAGTDRVSSPAGLTIFPMDASSARLAYRVFVEAGADRSYETLIDAEDGTLLFRHHLNLYAAQARVWTQSPAQGARELLTFPESWLPATGATTTGNNADAYIDANGDDRPDALNNTDMQNGRPNSPSQIFDYPFGDGLTGLDPRNFKPAAVTNLFYLLNVAHDHYYNLGFTEAAGNFQRDNFSLGGLGNDPVLGEAQFGGFTSNAMFLPAPDGTSPKIRVGIFTRGTSSLTDDIDADYDGQTILHEYGHGVSNRLVGARTSTSCLNRIQSAALGEGWSDYFAISMYNNPVFGSYVTQNFIRGFRRQSYDKYSLTYEDIGAGNFGYEAHDDGEIWAGALWDLRQSLGQTISDRLVVSGLKSTPCHPSMTDARDAILTADQATNAGANRAKIWQVFARHGLGFSAAGTDGSLSAGTRYDAAYDVPVDIGNTRNPAITSNPLVLTASLGAVYTYAIGASNPNTGTLNYALLTGPNGMTVDAATGMVHWTAGFTGPRVKVAVTDGRGGRIVHGYLLPVFTQIATGTPVTIDAARDTTGYAYVNVPSDVTVLQVTLRGGTGDADLWVANPDGFYNYSSRIGNNETLSFPSPKAGRWQIEVDGYDNYSAVSMTATLITPTLLGASGNLSGVSGVEGSETLYRVSLPPGASSFTVSTSGGTGDVDLYLRKGKPALCQLSILVSTSCFSDQSSEETGNAESITLTTPDAGDYYVDLSGYKEFAGVTLSTTLITGPLLVVGSGSLTFAATEGGPAPASQTLSISNPASPAFDWTASAATASGGSWLQLSQTSGTGNASVRITANSTGLKVGTYQGSITVTAAGLAGSPQTVAVTLRVSGVPTLVVNAPLPLTFQATVGQTPAAQPVTVTNSGGGTLSWTATTNAEWLRLTPASGTGNGTVQVSAVTTGLTPGTYTGLLTITAAGVAGSPKTVFVTLTLTAAVPLPTISANGLVGGGGSNPPVLQISPGGSATIYGANFAPAGTARSVQAADLIDGVLPIRFAGLCVDVDGKPAYLTFVSPEQVNFQVPAIRTGTVVNLKARSNCGQASEVSGPVVSVFSQPATPEFLYWARPADGRYPVVAVNSITGAYVGPAGLIPGLALAPAKPGDILTIYGVSFGPTNPAYAAGTAPAALGSTANSATVRLGSDILASADVLYAGVSPGSAGLYQLNIRIPETLGPGNYSLKLSLGTFDTPLGYVIVEAR